MFFAYDKTAAPIKGVTKEQIVTHVINGGTVDICTCLKAWRINKRALDRWNKAGYELIKEKNGSLYLGRGRHYDCIDGCHIIFN